MREGYVLLVILSGQAHAVHTQMHAELASPEIASYGTQVVPVTAISGGLPAFALAWHIRVPAG